MTIRDVINKYYNDLLATCTNDKAISFSRTEYDILNDVCITAMNKYKDKAIDEMDALNYLKKSLLYEKKYQFNRKSSDLLDYYDNIASFEKPDE